MPEEKEASTSSGNETNGDAVDGKEKAEENAVSFHKLFAFADSLDKILMIIGSIGAVGNGLCLPLMTVLFGELVDSFGQNQTKGVVEVVSKVKPTLPPCLGLISSTPTPTLTHFVFFLPFCLGIIEVCVFGAGMWCGCISA